MTRLVLRNDLTPEELYEATRWVAYAEFKAEHAATKQVAQDRARAAVRALFRPAEDLTTLAELPGAEPGADRQADGVDQPPCSCASCNPLPAPVAPPPAEEREENDPAIASAMDEFVLVKRDALAMVRRARAARRLRSELAASQREVDRYAAVLRLCAGDVVTCYPTDDGTVKIAVNLNDYFVPASDGEEIEMADAPTLVALLDHGGWPAIYQWVADRRGVPNRHWRLKPPIDSASAPSGENRSER